jgi:hypothetical protein
VACLVRASTDRPAFGVVSHVALSRSGVAHRGAGSGPIPQS